MRKSTPVTCDHCARRFRSGAGLALHLRHVNGEFSRRPMSPEGDARRIAAIKAKRIRRASKPCARPECSTMITGTPSEVARRKFCSKRCLGFATPRPPLSTEQRQKLAAVQRQRYADDPTSNPFYGRTPTNYQGWGHGGYVPELGHHVRSTWERDYLIGLKRADIAFVYEPRRFDLGKGRGTYLPDIQLWGLDIYVEITGWDKPTKVAKRDLFSEVYGYLLHVVDQPPTPDSIAALVAFARGVKPNIE